MDNNGNAEMLLTRAELRDIIKKELIEHRVIMFDRLFVDYKHIHAELREIKNNTWSNSISKAGNKLFERIHDVVYHIRQPETTFTIACCSLIMYATLLLIKKT